MIIGQVADTSPYKIFKAAAAIESGAFSAVTLGESGVKTSAAGEIPIGILSAESSDKVSEGEEVNVQTSGSGLWVVGEAVKAGELLTAGDEGKAVVAQSGKYVMAIALEEAEENMTAAVQIVHGGMKG